MRTFTDDETGEKFELLAERIDTWDLKAGALVIKPIKAVEKNATYLEFVWGRKKLFDDYTGQYTLPTAQKVAEALEALMEGLQDSKMQDFPNDLADKFIKARAAFRGEV